MKTIYALMLIILTGVGLQAAQVQRVLAQAEPTIGQDICRDQRNEPRGCFDLRLARNFEEWGRWKEAEQEYIQAGRIGAPCVRKEAIQAIRNLKQNRQKDAENFELEVGKKYSGEGSWKEAERHYSAAGTDSTTDERFEALNGITAARKAGRAENFELSVADEYFKEGAWKEAEQYYLAAGKGTTADERNEALTGLKQARREAWLGDWYHGVGEKAQDTNEKLDRVLGYLARILNSSFSLLSSSSSYGAITE